MTDRDATIVLGSANVLGLAVVAYYLFVRPWAIGVDYRVYDAAARAALAGGDFYAVTPPDTSFHYLYPPVTVLGFVPPAVVSEGWLLGFLALTVVSVLASLWAARVLVEHARSMGHDLDVGDRVLVATFLLVSVHAAPSLVFGQVNHLVVASLVAGFAWLECGRSESWAGVALALPAFLKVVPAVAGAWLLARRAWRAVAAAVGTALLGTVAGLLVFGPATTRTYVTDVLLPRRASDALAAGLDPAAHYVTIRRPLSVLFPTVDPAWYAVGAVLVLAPPILACYWRPRGATDRLVGVHATLVGMLLVVPSLLEYYSFLAFPLILLLYDLPAGRGRVLFVLGATVANVAITMEGVAIILDTLSLAPGTSVAIAGVLRPVLTYGTPILWGCLLTLAGCLVYRVESGGLPNPRERARQVLE